MSDIDILFVHNNFPAQFRNLASRFSACEGVRVAAIATRTSSGMPGVKMERYSFSGAELGTVHPFARRFEIECRRAEQVMYAANALRASGFMPRLIYVHPGWGEALPLRVIFPDATICCYAEFYYAPSGTDVGFDREFPKFGIDGEARVTLRNASNLLSLADANYCIAPTEWQRSVFPREFRSKIHVVHDGLDVRTLYPLPRAPELPIAGQIFAPDDEVVTFVSRNLEPYRGFHIFMRALPQILKARPKARICLMGGDQVSYGAAPLKHASWRAALLEEMGGALDLSRVHFLGSVPYEEYLALLSRSQAHVYLTYPFVLSWSMLEAMALECLVVGSDTPPVAEVIENGVNGLLVPFFDVHALAGKVIEALAEPGRFRDIRHAARETVISRYDFNQVCWPEHLRLIEEFACTPKLLDLLHNASG